MQRSPDAVRTPSWRVGIIIGALAAGGFALTLVVFYPGIMTFDAWYVHADIAKHSYGDWQSPVMTVLWGLIEPIAPGPASMFLLIATSYWLAFAVAALTVARRSAALGILLPLLALLPPAFDFVGIIWRDILQSALWLLAAVIVYAAVDSAARRRVPVQVLALALCVLGYLLRPNALFAAPILAAYLIWPARFAWKRAVVGYLPAVAIFLGAMHLTYYEMLDAKRQHLVQTIMVYDLGGITLFSKENQFPVSWSEAETAHLFGDCYSADEWDTYWRLQPCQFVMKKLESEKLFGTSALTQAWLRAVLRHPIAYLEHRSTFMWSFLTGQHLSMWLIDIENSARPLFPGRTAFAVVVAIHDALQPTPLFRVGTWLLTCAAICVVAWRRRDTPDGAFAIGIAGSAVIYVLTFYPTGVATDFRYAYWAVLATLTGGVIAALEFVKPRSA